MTKERTAVVIEDVPLIRDNLRGVLERKGFSIESYSSSEDALKAVKKQAPQDAIVISDLLNSELSAGTRYLEEVAKELHVRIDDLAELGEILQARVIVFSAFASMAFEDFPEEIANSIREHLKDSGIEKQDIIAKFPPNESFTEGLQRLQEALSR